MSIRDAIICRIDENSPIVLSSAQFRLWFLNQMDPDSAAYNMGGSFDWPGTVDGQVLQSAVDHIVQRHESLRTTFSMSGGDPVQVISPSSEISVGIAEWAPDLDRSKREWLESQYRSVADHPFDLERGPLLRVALLSVGPAEHVLVVVMHHIISDGWSMQVFLRELFESYHALANQKQPSLPELPIQYADYALWQRERLTSPAMQNEVNYWRTVLADAPAQLSFPDADPTANDYSGETIHFRIDAETVEALKVLAKAENATLFMVLSAAFKWALYEVTGQTDLLVGTPVSGRDRPEVEHLIGFFVNTVILRTNLEGIQSFRELVRRERDVILDAFSHQSLPFDELVRTLNPKRNSQVPYLSVLMNFLPPTPDSENIVGGSIIRVIETPSVGVGISVRISELKDGIDVRVESAPGLSSAANGICQTVPRILGSSIERLSCE
ncbi:condensation domain-containing protein (plasmid) [Glutamicibacter sp. FR1]|uniref:condensation domain-containing protein n=1 Tax=Glutamicibacter sp. FR1 TaxID=3393744 RepID=UPI0039B11D28